MTSPNGTLSAHNAYDISGIIVCRTCWSRVELSWSPLGVRFAYCRGIDNKTPFAEHECDPMVVLPTEVGGLPTATHTEAEISASRELWRDHVLKAKARSGRHARTR